MNTWNRNEEIWRRRTYEGSTLRELAKEYGISPERVRQIVFNVDRIYNPDSYYGPTLRDRFIREFSPMVEDRGQCAMSIKGIFNALMRGRPREIRDGQPKDFLDWLTQCTDEDFGYIRGLGTERIAIIRDIQKAVQSTDGIRDGYIRVDGCKISDLYNLEEVSCGGCGFIDVPFNLQATRYGRFFDNEKPDYEDLLKKAFERNRDHYLTILDLHF